jgi:hypothetical protein
MRYLMLHRSEENDLPPTTELMTKMGAYIEKSFNSGVLIATEGCRPSALGAHVRISNGGYTVTDGPFSEAKEIIGGFAMINAASKEEAIEHAKEFLEIVGRGETEIRQVAEMSDHE